MKKAFRLNIITFCLILFSSIWMFSGIHFGNAPTLLEGSRLQMFKFYTVDSNVLMGIIALVAACIQKNAMKNNQEALPQWYYIMKLVGVVGVTLTMLVTIFFLTPTLGFYACFNNSNVFLHLINPVISIICFVCFENTDRLKFKHTFTGVSTMIIYAVYYVAVSIIHSHGNVVDPGYDWYGFFTFGLTSGFIVVPLLIVITYIISFGLWKLNRIFYKK